MSGWRANYLCSPKRAPFCNHETCKPLPACQPACHPVRAQVNMAQGVLDPKVGSVVVEAASEVADGKLDDHFPLVIWQVTAVTPSNDASNGGDKSNAGLWLGVQGW